MVQGWLQPPRLRIGEENEEPRHATWLELFYDLVFVVAVSQVAHYLYDHVSLSGFLGFVFLFIPIWWAWIGATFYANRFDNDSDIGHRLLTGVQMIAIAALAVNVHGALGESSAGFAFAYAAGRVVLVIEYLRVAKYISQARALATRYATGFAIAAILWVISIFVPIPLRFILWGLGLAVDFATPITARKLQIGLFPHTEHLPERFGLFTIIVLGEAIIAVVDGVAEQHWDIQSAIAAIFGFGIAFSLWWVYFDNVGSTALRSANATGQIAIYQVWLYGHLPLVIGIAAAGVGVEHVVAHEATKALSDAERWLICGAVALCLLSLALLHRTGIIFKCKVRTKYRIGAACFLLAFALVGRNLSPLVVIGVVAVVCALQIVQDMYQGHSANWVKQSEI